MMLDDGRCFGNADASLMLFVSVAKACTTPRFGLYQTNTVELYYDIFPGTLYSFWWIPRYVDTTVIVRGRKLF